MARQKKKEGTTRSGSGTGPGHRAQVAYSIPVPIGRQGEAEVEIRLSPRRRKSSQAHLEEGKVVVVVPAALGEREREDVAARLARRLLAPAGRREINSDAALARRAAELGRLYLDGTRPRSIRWVTNQTRRWGSCTPADGSIRISSRLASMPSWVLDAVIVHELAHLVEPSHSEAFKELCRHFPRSEEADAYLLGFEHGATTATMDLGPIPSEGWSSTTPEPSGEGRGRQVPPANSSPEEFSQLSFG